MRLESRTWFGLSLLFLVGAVYFWHRGNEYERSKSHLPTTRPTALTNLPTATNASRAPLTLLSQVGSLQSGKPQSQLAIANAGSAPSGPSTSPSSTNRIPHRLSNTDQPLRQLTGSDTAILMHNAFIDTARGTDLPIPEHLRAKGDPASYIVQARGTIQAAFRAQLEQAGAQVVAYIPNNAYLVELSGEGAGVLAAKPEVQAVLPYQPYFKLDGKL